MSAQVDSKEIERRVLAGERPKLTPVGGDVVEF